MKINRKTFIKKIKKNIIVKLSFMLAAAMLFTVGFTPSFASAKDKTDEPLTIKLVAGSTKMDVNGTTIKTEKTYLEGKKLYIPVKAVLEAFGAEVSFVSENRVSVIYRDNTAEITAGNPVVLLNNVKCILTAPPVLKNRNLMVPVEFLNKFIKTGLLVTASEKGAIIKLMDDGALTDLTFLIGSIAQPRAGNSYFGWSMNVPKGSRIGTVSFNSKYIDIENDQRALAVEISVESTDGKSLKGKFDKMLEELKDSAEEDYIDSALQDKTASGTLPYAELLSAGRYEEAIYERIYTNGRFFYIVKMTSAEETDPEVLRNEKYYRNLMDSFKLDYDGTAKDVANLSLVRNGYAEYENYINSEAAGKKIKTWSMSFLPEWDTISLSSYNPYSTVIGIDKSEYASVDMAVLKEGETAAAYGAKMKKFYDDNFNPLYYRLVSSGNVNVDGTPVYMLQYEIKMGSRLYRYDERFVDDNGFVYDITFKTASDKYSTELMSFEKMFQSFQPLLTEDKEISEDIAKSEFNKEKSRISKEDTVTKYTGKSGNWSIEIPGYWMQKTYSGKNMESFENDDTGASVIIESVENKVGAAAKADEEKFTVIKGTISDSIKLKAKENAVVNNIPVRVYKYRIDDEESEDYADIVFYVFDKGNYSYCFMSTIQDLCTSSRNVNELDAIWNSFTLMENDK